MGKLPVRRRLKYRPASFLPGKFYHYKAICFTSMRFFSEFMAAIIFFTGN
jgi:hypothetical protein